MLAIHELVCASGPVGHMEVLRAGIAGIVIFIFVRLAGKFSLGPTSVSKAENCGGNEIPENYSAR